MRAYTRLSEKCPSLLANFNQCWNGARNFNCTPQHKVVGKFLQRVSRCFMLTNTQANE